MQDVLREVVQDGRSDEQIEAEFGAPEVYAEALAPGRGKRRAGMLIIAGCALAIVWLLVIFLDETMGWGLRGLLGPVALLPAVVLLGAGVLGQFLLDLGRR